MGAKTSIEWTDASWTPIRARYWEIQSDGSGKERIGWHCEHASTGCINCYSESMNNRLGTGMEFKPGNLYREEAKGYHNGAVKLFLDEKMLQAPLRWKRPRMVFVCSMTDLFADFVTDEWLSHIFVVMAMAPQHTFQVLTKRAERMRAFLSEWSPERLEDLASDFGYSRLDVPDMWPLPNVWFGVSTERQQEADERIPHLLQTPAAVRFISAEPLLGPVDLGNLDCGGGITWNALGRQKAGEIGCLDWIIVGGESGHDARPFNLEWADSIVDQCKAADLPCFVKQLGSKPMSAGYPHPLKDRKGGDPAEWPDRLNVRAMPERVRA